MLVFGGLRRFGPAGAQPAPTSGMSKIIFEVPQKNGALVSARIGATNHSEEPHTSPLELAVGGALVLLAVGFVFFLLTL